MERFALGRQRVQDLRDLVYGQQTRRVDDLDVLRAVALRLPPALRQRWHRLEAPFLVGDPAEGVVTVVDDGSLPPLVLVFPFRPRPRRLRLDPVRPRLFACGGSVDLLAVEKGAPRGYGQQEEPHRAARVGSCAGR